MRHSVCNKQPAPVFVDLALTHNAQMPGPRVQRV